MTNKIIRIEKENPDNEQFLVNWMLHDRCTYDCSYCPPANKRGKDDWLKITFSKEFVDKLEARLIEQGQNKNVIVHFTGGEPTVWPKFIELVDYINSKGWSVDITTNGSRSLDWWKENAQKFNHISMSYHSEHVDDDEFMEKAKYLATELSYYRFYITVMMNPARWDKCTKFVERLFSGEIITAFDVRPLQPDFGLTQIDIQPYTQEQLNFIGEMHNKVRLEVERIIKSNKKFKLFKWWPTNKTAIAVNKRDHYVKVEDNGIRTPLSPNELIFNKQVNFYNWKCNIGLEQIFINSLGNIHGGTCLQGQLIGNIQDPDNLVWPTGPTTCKALNCGCYTDIKITKWKQ